MIELEVFRLENATPVGLRAGGHSTTAPRGENPVCAAVSTIFELLIAAAASLPASSVKYRREAKLPLWELTVSPAKLSDRQLENYCFTLKAAVEVLIRIAEKHPEECRLVDSKQD